MTSRKFIIAMISFFLLLCFILGTVLFLATGIGQIIAIGLILIFTAICGSYAIYCFLVVFTRLGRWMEGKERKRDELEG